MKTYLAHPITLGMALAVGFFASIVNGQLRPDQAPLKLEPAFRIVQIEGECFIRRPGDAAFEPAVDGRAYPFGSRIRTGADATAVLSLAPQNTVRVLANTDLVITEVSTAREHKRLLLDAGEVEVTLTEGFHAGNNRLDVETVSSIVTPRGTRFRVAVQIQEDLLVVIIRCLDGSLQIIGRVFPFQISELGENDWVSMITPADHSFLRMKNLRGEFEVRVPEGDNDIRDIVTATGVTLKIWQEEITDSDDIAVSIAITDSEGRLIETIVATIPAPEIYVYEGGSDDAVTPGPPQKPGRRRPPVAADFTDIGTRPSPMGSTTALPSPTPVGRR